ncbi:hypothetical protein [Ruegeria halocynthiae]|uniref:hypothetical protein n=1 Tax=Ruegeria halocynthiae TaxID=985054 RepID=UPI000560CD49|nr:hypothetical protein [Ruegeria halocynthiae]
MQRTQTISYVGFLFIAGFFATMAFDFWGQVISPSIGWANLSPEGLAQSLLASLGLPSSAFLGFFVHFYIVGLIAYPLGWVLVFNPVWSRVLGPGYWGLASALYGFGLWVFAIGGVTTFAGLPPFLNFTGIAWVALIGHVLYGIVMVAILRWIERQTA